MGSMISYDIKTRRMHDMRALNSIKFLSFFSRRRLYAHAYAGATAINTLMQCIYICHGHSVLFHTFVHMLPPFSFNVQNSL